MPTIVKTPRKDKVWGVKNLTTDGGWNVEGGPKINPILDELKADLGLSSLSKITIMRVVGRVWLGPLGAASTAANVVVQCGFAWVAADVAAQASGDSSIPAPLEEGMRRTRWYHQFAVAGKEKTSALEVAMPLEPADTSVYDFDITNQQKQQSAGDEFSLIINDPFPPESATVGLFGHIQVMVALP